MATYIAAERNVTSWREDQRIRQTDRHTCATPNDTRMKKERIIFSVILGADLQNSKPSKIEISAPEQGNPTMERKSVWPVGDGHIVRSGARTFLPWLSAAALLIGCIAVVTSSSRFPIRELGVSLCTGDQSCFCENTQSQPCRHCDYICAMTCTPAHQSGDGQEKWRGRFGCSRRVAQPP